MQKIIVPGICMCIIFNSFLNTKQLMPTIDRVKKKIKTIEESNHQQSFKELLAGAHNGIITLDTNQELNTYRNVACIEKQFSKLYWAHQTAFITKLISIAQQSTKLATETLKTKIKEYYTQTTIPFMAFAHDLATEKLFLQTITTDLLKLSNNTSISNSEKQNIKSRLQNLYTQHLQCQELLHHFIDIVNTLLIG